MAGTAAAGVDAGGSTTTGSHAHEAASAPSGTSSNSALAATQTLGTIHVTAQALRDEYAPGPSSVGAKIPTASRDIPQTVVQVDRALLDAQGATSLSDALRNVPGITLGAAEGGQIGNNINLRGFSARTDIYLDGFRDRGQYYRDTFDLESVDVLEGPSSMLFGRGSTGGVINQVSKEPELRAFGSASTTIGTDDRYRVSADLNQPLSDSSAFRINAFGQDLHSTRDVMSQKDGGVAPTLKFGIGTDTTLTLSALLQHNDDMPDYGLPPVNGHPAEVNHDNFYGLTDDRTKQDVGVFGARMEHEFHSNVTLREQLQYSHYRTDARETAPNNLVEPDGTVPNRNAGNPTELPLEDLAVQLASHDRVIHDSSLFNQADLIAKFTTGRVAHTLIAGSEIGRDRYDNQGYTRSGLPTVSLVDPAYFPQPADVVSTPGNLAQASADTYALYVNDTAAFGDHWKVVAGLRRDRFDAELDNTTSQPPDAHQLVYFTSKRAGVIWQPDESQSYYASYGTSFDPSLEALTVSNGTQALPPEQNESYEIGGKWDLGQDALSLNAAVFQVTKTNARTQVAPGDYELDGNVRVRGEVLGIVGHLTQGWQVFGGYTHYDAEIVRALDGTQGNVPANTPDNAATLWTTWKPDADWEFGGGANYVGARFASNSNTVSVGGYTRWDATVAWHQPRYDLRLNLWNLTDKSYFDALIPSDGGRAVPGIGRTAMVTATWHY
ncbi:MAG: TonB-dependent siderophore receptor [Proteobacteria bacterium]|nr:TonB-dependent siderophore receptor [Pseudomonadota bacterium]